MQGESELKTTIAECEAGIVQKNKLLNKKNNEYVVLVENRAQARRAWRMAYRQGMMTSDQPVTIKKDMVKGSEEISKLEMEYEIALGIERACLESMRDLRSQLDALRSFLSWHKSERFPSSM